MSLGTLFCAARRRVSQTAPGGTWTEVIGPAFNLPGGTKSNEPGWNGYTLVMGIPVADFDQTGGSKIRVTLDAAPTGEDMTIKNVYLANGGGADRYDFGEAPVQLKFGGSDGVTVLVGGNIVSDEVTFVKDAVNALVVAIHFNNSAADDIGRYSPIDAGWNADYKLADDAITQNKSGYVGDNVNGWRLVSKVELLI